MKIYCIKIIKKYILKNYLNKVLNKKSIFLIFNKRKNKACFD